MIIKVMKKIIIKRMIIKRIQDST